MALPVAMGSSAGGEQSATQPPVRLQLANSPLPPSSVGPPASFEPGEWVDDELDPDPLPLVPPVLDADADVDPREPRDADADPVVPPWLDAGPELQGEPLLLVAPEPDFDPPEASAAPWSPEPDEPLEQAADVAIIRTRAKPPASHRAFIG